MSYFRVQKKFEYRGQCNEDCVAKPGTLVDILTHVEADRLLAEGFIVPRQFSHLENPYSDAAKPFAVTKRVGVWLYTTPTYSGGRYYMYQIMYTLAQAGCEVFMITNMMPAWAKDYPPISNLKILLDRAPVPPDLDIILTDSKDAEGQGALEYKELHPNAMFVCMSFETANWVRVFIPEFAKQISFSRGIFSHADLFLACSNQAAKYLLEWMKDDNPRAKCQVIRPVVNMYALREADKSPWPAEKQFAVWTGRPSPNKGGDVAFDAVMELDEPFDLITFGEIERRGTPKHRLIPMTGRSDVDKFRIMKGAKFILAPSLFEGYGMIPREALACETPCVVYDLPVLREEYGEPTGIHYVPWGDEVEFKAVVKRLAREPKPKLDGSKARKYYGMKAMAQGIQHLPYFSTKRAKVTVSLLSYWGFLPQSLESVAPYVDQIIICHGSVSPAAEIDDGSLARIAQWMDESGFRGDLRLKVRDRWESKEQMREFAARRATGNRFLVLNGDEIWVGLDKWLEADIKFGAPRFVHLWHDLDHWIHDAPDKRGIRWGKALRPFGSVCPVYRWSWWRSSYSFQEDHSAPIDIGRNLLRIPDGKAAKRVPEAVIYHVEHVLTKWQRSGEIGECDDGIVEKVNWELPEIVKRAYATACSITVIEDREVVKV